MDDKVSHSNNCESMRSKVALYSIPEAAALWCEIAEADLQRVIGEVTEYSILGGVYKHPYISCLEIFSTIIGLAVEERILPHSRENGRELLHDDGMAAYHRRHVTGKNLREWMEIYHPNEKPSFLFDDLERDTHTAISAESYRSLTVDRDALKARIDKAEVEYRKLKAKNIELTNELNIRNGEMASNSITDTTQRNYELAIGLLTKALADKAGANCGTQENPNISGLSELLQQYLPADDVGSLSNKALSISTLRKRLKKGYDSLKTAN